MGGSVIVSRLAPRMCAGTCSIICTVLAATRVFGMCDAIICQGHSPHTGVVSLNSNVARLNVRLLFYNALFIRVSYAFHAYFVRQVGVKFGLMCENEVLSIRRDKFM